jgi:DNA-binding beta-propeller fold protein YncE
VCPVPLGSQKVTNLMKTIIKTCAIIAAVLVPVLLPISSFSGAAVKFRHIISIYADDKDLGLKHPEGIACNEKSSLIVADTGNGRLLRYTFQNNALEKGAVEIIVPQLSYPIGTQMNSKGEIYALDGKQRRIVRQTPEGKFINYLDPIGLPAPASYVPRSFTIDGNDTIYILDILSRRVLVLSPKGEYLRQIKFPKKYGFFSDITIDFKGNILLIDSTNAVVFSTAKNAAKLSALTGSLKQYMRFPTSITTDKRGRIYLVDRNGGRIIVLGQDGSFLGRLSGRGWKEGLLNHPSNMCINSKGEVFIADTSNSRVQIFTILE